MEIPNEAGQELDALVAEYIMGWTPEEGAEPGQRLYRTPEGARVNRYNVPPYSTGLAAAWTVVEHILQSEDNALFVYFYGSFMQDPGEWLVPAPQLCLLICRSALAAYNEAHI
jgi:hypothetical protein